LEFQDYYEILGIKPEADKKAIKTAYRRLARRFHPDVSTQHDAEEKFKEVSEAYEVLGNDEKRAEYDQLRKYGTPDGAFKPPPGWHSQGQNRNFNQEDFSDFFESVFGSSFQQGNRQGNRRGYSGNGQRGDVISIRGQDIEIDMPVFLEDIFSANSKTIQYQLPHFSEQGRVADIKKTLKVNIPKGTSDGERIRLRNQGAPGYGDGPPGDLYLRIKLIPHPLFDVKGHDLLITVPITPWEAAIGSKINVPTLKGRISLTIKPNSQTGQRLRIKGKGLPLKKGQGDLYSVLKVVMPPKTSHSAKQYWQKLAESENFDPRKEWRNV